MRRWVGAGVVPVVLASVALVFCFGAAELLVRYIGEFDGDGQFWFRGIAIRPHTNPIQRIRQLAPTYQALNWSRMVYHPILGWTPRPDHTVRGELYHYNSLGLRSDPREVTDSPAPDVLRIALFGDSFTHGDQVRYENTFGFQMEEKLKAAGLAGEVLNFGVPGYGMDQALLRFRHEGASMSPHIVVFGFQPENIKRNVNLVRAIYNHDTGLPFAKPRFVLEGDSLRLINVPVLPVDDIIDMLIDPRQWELIQHESFYDPSDYTDNWWRRSKLLAVLVDVSRHHVFASQESVYHPDSAPARLALKIIETFEREVRAAGAKFLIVHLPRKHDLATLVDSGTLEYQELLDELDRQYEVVRPETGMVRVAEEVGIRHLFVGHYSRRGNRVVAEALCDYISREAALPAFGNGQRRHAH